MSSYFLLRWGVQIPYTFHENQTPRSDSVNLEHLKKTIFSPQNYPGYQYDNTTLSNGTNIPSYGNPQRLCSHASKLRDRHCRPSCTANVDTTDDYFNDIFVYDTKTDTYGVASGTSQAEPCLLPPGCGPYPLNVNIPTQSVRGNRIFTVGGEADARNVCGSRYQHYPTLALLGTIAEVNGDSIEGR